MADRDEIDLRRCATCGGLVGYAPEELSRIPTSAVYGVCSCPMMVPAADSNATLDHLVREFLGAATFDVRQFFNPVDGSIRKVSDIPRPLTLLVGGVKIKRLMPIEWADVLGVPAAEIVELKWESQAKLLLRAIELMTNVIERNRKGSDNLTDEEVEQGSLEFIAQRHPELAKAHPEIFGRKKVKP